MTMNYTFLDSPNFSCLKYPKLKNIPDSTLASITNTKPLLLNPGLHPKLRNPILTLTAKKGFWCIWGFKSTLNQIKITEKRSIVKSSKYKKLKLPSHILSVTASGTSKSALLMILTETSYLTMNYSFEILSKCNGKFIDVHFNPYFPTQLATLTDSCLQPQANIESTFPCSGFVTQ